MAIRATAKRRALIVDDCRTSRAWIRAMLERFGFECIEASTVREALLLINNEFDLIAVDYELHGMTGVVLVKEIRAAGILASVVMISAHDLGAYAARLGCGFVMKG